MVTQAELKELFDYNPETGLFLIKKSRIQSKIGLVAGNAYSRGYIKVSINRKAYQVHRLIWVYVHGDNSLKDLCIDHINRDKSDNRLINLRLVTRSINQRNHSLSKSNKSGKRGVYFATDKNRWTSQIKNNEMKTVSLGYYKDFRDAVKAREMAEIKYGYIA